MPVHAFTASPTTTRSTTTLTATFGILANSNTDSKTTGFVTF